MLAWLGRGLRFRLAAALSLFAALCFVAPPAALTFGHGANALDCLANAHLANHGNGAKSHDLAHRGDHSPVSGSSAPAGKHDMTCCGLFCLSALAVECATVALSTPAAAPLPAGGPNLFSGVAERLDRPPISLPIV